MPLSLMERKTLIPKKIINIFGKILYNENSQSWSKILFKKEFVSEFPELMEKRSSFSYEMKYFRTKKEMLKAVKNLNEDGVMPVLVWLYNDED